MTQKHITTLLLCVLLMFLSRENLEAYSAKVHEKITTETIDQNANDLNKFMTANFGLAKGIDEYLNNKRVRDWMVDGSWMEDIGVDLLTSHFYDPLTNKGYSVLGVEVGQSAYDSANDLSNFGAWAWARKRLYDGLTQTDKTLREKYLGIAFQALGRTMHLVQDVAVPAHTRNDGHMPWVDSEPYEDYTNKHVKDFVYTSVPFPYWNLSISSQAPKQFWDLDSYNGSVVYASGYIGLAEYTNPNFFSKDTIFKDYPHPSFIDTNYPNIDWKHPEIVDAEDGNFDNRIYITKTVGEPISHLTSISYISYDVIKKGYYKYSPFVLDDACHNEYAQKLLPRAVGYSAGLLDYFFRGEIEITLPDNGVYAITPGTVPVEPFKNIHLKARNVTATGEELTASEIKLVVKYKLVQQDPFHTGWLQTSDFLYIVAPETSGAAAIPRATPVELVFDLAQTPLPLWATDVYLQVVMKGRLGNEDGAVAVGYKDVSEPTPVDVANIMDRICLNGSWYTAGSPQAVAVVDANGDGIAAGPYEWDVYPHNLKDIYLRSCPLASPTPCYATSTDYTYYKPSTIEAGTYKREAYIISDYQFTISSEVTVVNTDSNDHWVTVALPYISTGQALKRQTENATPAQCDALGIIRDPNTPCVISYYPSFNQLRGWELWGGAGLLYQNEPYPAGTTCPEE